MEKRKTKVGLVGLGLDTYWPQFEGLYARLCGYQDWIASKMSRPDTEVINAGIADNPVKAVDVAEDFKKEDISILFVFISTYALSSTVLPLAQRVKVPVILLNIQPTAAIDYDYINNLGDRGKMTGEWLAHCQACSVPEFACVFNRSGIPYEIVSGYLQEEYVWKQINNWIDAVRVVNGMKNNRMGILGHYYCGMLDVYTDLTQQSSVFGTHVEIVEMCELKAYRDNVTEEDVKDKLDEFNACFDIDSQCEPYELDRAARTSIALDRLIDAHDLGAMAYYYEGYAGNEYENIVTSVIAGNTLLTGRNIPIAGECEVKNVQAMKIMSLLGAGGSFSEFYALDFNDDIVMLGHDGPAHFAISEGKVRLVPLPVYHGKPGKGLSIQMTVKHGPVTLLSVCEGKDGIFLLAAEGESVEGPTLKIGNTNSRYRFTCGARAFIDNWSKAGPSHHCAIGIGHQTDKLEKIAFLLGIPIVKV
ncbi:L-fucose/L-arabinose isomerase family protein [Parabacteroides faecis]|uniref:L-fucose/L-arabinose isomerase family protein n=1 Tax=Parabacteroides faecis TaxID=1217282 RepID=UPI00216480F6|nr:L-fucose/L-arabinose isomerase family protein [Parabacteroides faecis]MCS2891793.1 L-fucose/L-arabinose isomerase family protein [Parabacteroides faecis]UVQ44595.1 L-fucose/L-arabinose isomerase family protein [Parabacteroides faecis]